MSEFFSVVGTVFSMLMFVLLFSVLLVQCLVTSSYLMTMSVTISMIFANRMSTVYIDNEGPSQDAEKHDLFDSAYR